MYFWSIVFVIALVAEVITAQLVSVWFAIAAIIMIPVSLLFKDNMIWQISIYLTMSLILLLALRKITIKSKLFDRKLPDDEVKVLRFREKISEEYYYDVRYKGVEWTAISDIEHNPGDLVKIGKFNGNKIILK